MHPSVASKRAEWLLRTENTDMAPDPFLRTPWTLPGPLHHSHPLTQGNGPRSGQESQGRTAVTWYSVLRRGGLTREVGLMGSPLVSSSCEGIFAWGEGVEKRSSKQI